jgi:NADP-dependent 3-hydroxy acid dehydrogenase YdfG
MTQNVEGKVVAITGASSGLGEATAQHLAAAGAKLVLGARRLDRLQALAGEQPGTDAAMQTDVTDREQVKGARRPRGYDARALGRDQTGD